MWADIFLIAGSYLVGSAPHLPLLGRLKHVRLDGDLHMNLWQRGGAKVGLIGVMAEFVKGIIPVVAGKALDFSLATIVLAGLAVVAGQMWPVFSRFNGEKGNSIGVAMAGVLAPQPFFVAAVAFAAGAGVKLVPRLLRKRRGNERRIVFGGPSSRSIPLGMMCGFLLLPFASWWLREPVIITYGLTALFVLIMLRRLTAGLTEDFKTKNSIWDILVNRLLYDRGCHT